MAGLPGNVPALFCSVEFFVKEKAMTTRLLYVLGLIVFSAALIGCDTGSAQKKSDEPVVQELEIETGEAFDPAAKKDGE
jgi:hypothetical protein